MIVDRHRLRRQLDQLRRNPDDDRLAQLTDRINASVQRAADRRARRPELTYPDDLPITQHREAIVGAIRDHPVVVICGDTGSGKSTQLPKLCLEAGQGVHGIIGHTQPRRIAARSLATRIAEEMRTTVGREVGFKVRFTDTTREDTFVKLMTDGILLAESQGDRFLNQYDTLILDEAHERSLNIDFLLGYLHRLLDKRRDLKLIITSATIDPESFAEHFSRDGRPAPIIHIEGRTYPVEVRHRPLIDEETDPEQVDVPSAVLEALGELSREPRGDVLVFLPTERDILETAKLLRGAKFGGPSTEILPLYARLSASDQQRVFKPHKGRRIVLSTNVAETSLTVPGIRYVIDTGLARISRYSPRAGVQRLPIEPISQASADQRKGRCGRTAAGVCIRLYSEDDYQSREPFTPPEILRTNLSRVILQMKSLRLGEVRDFPFVEPPRRAAVGEGFRTLLELGAVDEQYELTDIGRKLAKLPVDPRVGRMILAGDEYGILADVLVIAAGLSIQDPRVRPPEQQGAADAAHEKFADESSDFITLMNVWDFYHEQMHKLSRSKLARACQQNFLSPTRMREWLDVYRQLRTLCEEAGLKPGQRGASPDAIHQALLTGLLANVAMRGEGHAYQVAGGGEAFLWPGSVLFENKPRWIMAAELVETTRHFARMAAPINPSWIEPIAGHLLSRTYSEPFFNAETGHVQAYEKVSLFGLPIVPRRAVHYGAIDPAKSREMLIHHGLVMNELQTRSPAIKHNRELAEQVERMEAKLRQRDILAEETARFEFYDQRIPKDVVSGPGFDQWAKQVERENPNLLRMTEADLMRRDAGEVTPERFPDAVRVGETKLPLEYRLEPGAANDGVTLTLPMAAAGRVNPSQLGWLVPGLLEQRVAAMIKSLPKSKRVHFLPAERTAAKVVEQLQPGGASLETAVARALSELAGVEVTPGDIDESQVPDHLKLNIRVVDREGKEVATTRDWREVRKATGQTADHVDEPDSPWQRDGLTRWDFGDLPESVEVTRAGVTLRATPTLVNQGRAVSLRLIDDPQRAKRQHHRGLRRLLRMQLEPQIRPLLGEVADLQRMTLLFAPLGDAHELKDQLIDRIVELACLFGEANLRTRDAFLARLDAGWNRLRESAEQAATTFAKTLDARQQAASAIDKAGEVEQWRDIVNDTRVQMKILCGERFLAETSWPWLQQYPRYLRGIVRRLEKVADGKAARDREGYRRVFPHLKRFAEAKDRLREEGRADHALEEFGWLLEEWRISVFAQELGTAIPVSEKRLEKQWGKVGR